MSTSISNANKHPVQSVIDVKTELDIACMNHKMLYFKETTKIIKAVDCFFEKIILWLCGYRCDKNKIEDYVFDVFVKSNYSNEGKDSVIETLKNLSERFGRKDKKQYFKKSISALSRNVYGK